MLAVTSVIVDYTFKNVFLTFCTLQVVPPIVTGPGVTYPPTLPFDGPGCVNNVLINALKN